MRQQDAPVEDSLDHAKAGRKHANSVPFAETLARVAPSLNISGGPAAKALGIWKHVGKERPVDSSGVVDVLECLVPHPRPSMVRD